MCFRKISFRAVAVVGIYGALWSVLGCSTTQPRRIYPPVDSGKPTNLPEILSHIPKGDKVSVILRDGGRFEAKFRSPGEVFPEFEHLRWIAAPLDGRSEPTIDALPYTYADISEISQYKMNTRGKIVAVAAAVVFASMVYVMASAPADSG